jgi:hypothetical protein
MDIDHIQNTYKFLVINTNENTYHVLKSERLVSKLLLDTYDIKLSHMYVRRNLDKIDYILLDYILIKKIWG